MEELVAQIHRAQQGDAQAYAFLVGRFQRMAYGYAYAMLGDFHLAQDAAQEAFVEAYRCLPGLREPLGFAAWLRRIVHKHCDRLTRRRRVEAVPLEAAARVAAPHPGPAETAERNEAARRVRGAIGELPEHQRQVTTLFYIGGYSHRQIADFLGVPAQTVKSRLHEARVRLKERMADMVEEELQAHGLPEGFTRETVEQAVVRSRELNRARQYDQAEELLRQVLGQVPGHAGALRELNRTLMHGRVYGQSRWNLLPELVRQGRTILETAGNAHVQHQVAATLLAVPAMPEAVAFIEEWIARRGPDLERLGMVAWARACVAEYDRSEATWAALLDLAGRSTREQVLERVPFVAYTLAECFAAAGEGERARRVATRAWDLCGLSGSPAPELAALVLAHVTSSIEGGWMYTFHHAGLDPAEAARALRHWIPPDPDSQAQAAVLCIGGWVDAPERVTDAWLAWVRERLAAGETGTLDRYRGAVLRGLRMRRLWQAADEMAHATWDLLGQAGTPEADQQRIYWGWELCNPGPAIAMRDWDAAEELVRRSLAERGARQTPWFGPVSVAAARGMPTPPEVVRAVEELGPEGEDGGGIYGWYVVAREAAASGNRARALEALRQALSCWSNPPLAAVRLWEEDTYWGALRQDPEVCQAFAERRRRIGPVYGTLHYFPGW
ncbi:MAG: sigma-70 family RNA polymerase sigma factor [Candidatus Latescibacterota bacterium]